MDTTKKILKVGGALFIVFALSGVGALSYSSQKAQVVSMGVSAGVFSMFNRNEIVLEAQMILKDLGLYKGKTSGLFGFKTRDALFAYQRSVSLPQTGILDIPTQQKLFAPPPPVIIEYTPIDHTKIGDQFLDEWVYYMSGSRTNLTQLQGVLVPAGEKISYGNHIEVSTHMLVTESGEYNVHNISDNSLESFSNKNVTVFGYLVQDEENSNRSTIIINYVVEDRNLDDFPRIGYTEEGDMSAKDWVEKVYDGAGEYIEEWGIVSVYRPMQHNANSHPTRVILRTERAKYAIENISSNDLERLRGENISLRGFLLSGTNELGYPTIVVNYFE